MSDRSGDAEGGKEGERVVVVAKAVLREVDGRMR